MAFESVLLHELVESPPQAGKSLVYGNRKSFATLKTTTVNTDRATSNSTANLKNSQPADSICVRPFSEVKQAEPATPGSTKSSPKKIYRAGFQLVKMDEEPVANPAASAKQHLEANYELIQHLGSTLREHLKRQDVISERSKELTIKCLDEITKICGICLKREARLRDQGEGGNWDTDNSGTGKKAVGKGKEIEGGLLGPAVEKREGTAERQRVTKSPPVSRGENKVANLDTAEAKKEENQSRVFIHSNLKLGHSLLPDAAIPNTSPTQAATPMPSAIIKIEDRLTQEPADSASVIVSKSGQGQVQSKATARPLLKIDTKSGTRNPVGLTHTTAVAHATPAADTTTQNYVTYRAVAPESLYSEEENSLKIWAGRIPQSNYDLYRPQMMTYPDLCFPDSGTPVFRAANAVEHKEMTTIWRNLSIKNSQEIFQWCKVYYEALEATVQFLFKMCERSKENSALWQGGQMWQDVCWPRRHFIEHMRQCYLDEYGQPQYLTTDTTLIQFLNTRDTICSMSTEDIDGKVYRIVDSTNSAGYRASIGSRSTSEMLHIRRHAPQIIVPYICHSADIGRPYELCPMLWDPHHAYAEIEASTTWTLDPPVYWLKWDASTKSFIGIVPCSMQVFDSENHQACGEVLTTESYSLNLKIQASTILPLPQGVQYERTIKGQMCLHICAPGRRNMSQVLGKTCSSSQPYHGPGPALEEGSSLLSQNSQCSENADSSFRGGVKNCIREHQYEVNGSEAIQSLQYDLSQPTEQVSNATEHKPVSEAAKSPSKSNSNGNRELTLGHEQYAKNSSYTSWNRQRSYIEACVSSQGRRMLGLLAGKEGDKSESSETELSDEESKLLKHIPFLTSYGKKAQAKWTSSVKEDEPPIPTLGRRKPFRERPYTTTPVLSPVKGYFNILTVPEKDTSKDSETKTQKEVISTVDSKESNNYRPMKVELKIASAARSRYPGEPKIYTPVLATPIARTLEEHTGSRSLLDGETSSIPLLLSPFQPVYDKGNDACYRRANELLFNSPLITSQTHSDDRMTGRIYEDSKWPWSMEKSKEAIARRSFEVLINSPGPEGWPKTLDAGDESMLSFLSSADGEGSATDGDDKSEELEVGKEEQPWSPIYW